MALPEPADYPAAYSYRFCPRCAAPLARRAEGGRDRLACTADGWVFYPAPCVAATAVVEHAGGIVLVRRAIPPDVGTWQLPIGHVEFGERPEAGAAREVAEATGLAVDEPAFLDFEHSPSSADPAMYYLVFCYRARSAGGDLRADHENSEVRIFPADALPPVAWTSQRRALAAWRAWREGRPWTAGLPFERLGV